MEKSSGATTRSSLKPRYRKDAACGFSRVQVQLIWRTGRDLLRSFESLRVRLARHDVLPDRRMVRFAYPCQTFGRHTVKRTETAAITATIRTPDFQCRNELVAFDVMPA
jgi:hypothetical protein